MASLIMYLKLLQKCQTIFSSANGMKVIVQHFELRLIGFLHVYSGRWRKFCV